MGQSKYVMTILYERILRLSSNNIRSIFWHLSIQISEFPCFRYLTKLQMGQFVTFFIHACFPLFIECDFPKIFSYVILFHGAMFFVLFANFYIQSYIKKEKRKEELKKKTDENSNHTLKQDWRRRQFSRTERFVLKEFTDLLVKSYSAEGQLLSDLIERFWKYFALFILPIYLIPLLQFLPHCVLFTLFRFQIKI